MQIFLKQGNKEIENIVILVNIHIRRIWKYHTDKNELCKFFRFVINLCESKTADIYGGAIQFHMSIRFDERQVIFFVKS